MLYLGIDQHKRQLTVNLRAEDGTVILKRQVSTQWEKVRAFFADLAEKARPEGGFLAILLKKKQKYRYDSPIKKHPEFEAFEGSAA
jgi:hypothetical protein